MCTCVEAIEKARAAALASRYLRTSASAVDRIRGDTGREGDAHERARRQAHALAHRGDRIQHGADRARQGAAVERHRRGRRSAAAEEPRAVGFPLHRSAEPPIDGEHVEGKGVGLVRRARTPAEQEPALCASYSVSMNSFPNAGWARSSSGGASTISA